MPLWDRYRINWTLDVNESSGNQNIPLVDRFLCPSPQGPKPSQNELNFVRWSYWNEARQIHIYSGMPRCMHMQQRGMHVLLWQIELREL